VFSCVGWQVTLCDPIWQVTLCRWSSINSYTCPLHVVLFFVVQMLLEFLDKVIQEPANKMTVENVAMVMAPNLFLVSSGSRNRPQAMDRELKLAVATSKITLRLLSNRKSLWTVSFFRFGYHFIKYYYSLCFFLQQFNFSCNMSVWAWFPESEHWKLFEEIGCLFCHPTNMSKH